MLQLTFDDVNDGFSMDTEFIGPRPGSPAAERAGCRCPVVDNHYGRGYMGIEGLYVQSADCPVHVYDVTNWFPWRKHAVPEG